ncbi:restriction endonuclease subunit S [Lactococcus lactis]|uniref:restriction endonuclease subunit S n=2 Tax=Lactococcus lactis TaxID=1358 RepID=UPI00117B1FE4|nr:restriction endonuclease subunit S [Lactococcus lactis]TRW74406.1 restriction endonuclease subunit S [Lactococcus lactis]
MAKIDDSVKKKVPELRFKGFTDDWEERKAKEMIKTHHFRSYLAEPNDVGNYEVIQQGDKPIAGYANGEPFEYFYDVTLFGDHTVSLFKPTKPFFIATDGVKIISANEFDGRYFYVTLERYKPASQGYKRHFTILKNEDIWFTTNKDEQVKIGTFFKQLDDTIALHQHKLDLLKEQKKGYLQKMFPKNGEKVPELRFAGFTDAWEQRKLGESCRIGDIDHRMPKSVAEGVPYLMTGDFIGENKLNFENTKLVSIEDYDQLSKKIKPEYGDILFARYASVGAVRYVDIQRKFLISYSCAIMKPNIDIKGLFLYQLLQTDFMKRKIEFEINPNSQKNIGIDSLKKLKISIPIIEEQEKIGKFFKDLDNTIALHQRKLDLLKEQKKGFLQKMFV